MNLIKTLTELLGIRKASKRVDCKSCNITPSSSLQFSLNALNTQHNSLISNLLGIECSIVEAILASRTTEALLVPFTTQGLNVFADDRSSALLAFRCSSFCSFGLATQAPCVPILLNVCHAFLKRITTFCAEEVSVMPALSQGNHVLANDRSLAVLTLRCEGLVEVKMTIESLSWITIFGIGLALYLWNFSSTRTPLDTVQTLSSLC